MTALAHGCKLLASAVRRGALGVAVVVTLAVAATAALAQQGWDAIVTGAVVAAKPAAAAAPKAKPIAAADGAAQPDRNPAAVKAAAKPDKGDVKETPAAEYCANIADPAADARFSWQKKLLVGMEEEIAKRIVALEEKTAELQKWLARRDEFSKKANETLLRIYARMRPDAAAVQLAALDEETAAALLIKLEPRTASLILNEMEPNQAVRLTGTISGAGKTTPAASTKNPTEAKAK